MAKYRIEMCGCEQCLAGRAFLIHIYKDGEKLVSFAYDGFDHCYHFRFGWQDADHAITLPESEDELLETFAKLVRNKLVDLDN